MKTQIVFIAVLLFAAAVAQCDPPCGAGLCCSKWGFCGTGEAYCGKHGEPTHNPPPQPTRGDGSGNGNTCNPPCGAGLCCSKWGFCGTGDAFCGGGHGTGTGTPPTHNPPPTHSSTGINPPPPSGGTGDNTGLVPAPAINGPKYVVYVDAALSWWGPGLAAAMNVPGFSSKNAYNVMALAFWLSASPADLCQAWASLDTPTKTGYLNAYHKAGMRVIASAFGATEMPTSANADPVATANAFANFIKAQMLDGGDVDYEDTAAFQSGKGAAWLVSFTKTLRDCLPSPKYTITHAPQGPYFTDGMYPDNAYLTIHKQAGDAIDWYNVQFYNQASTGYDTCETLLNKANGWATQSSLFEMVGKGIPASKIIIGKPISQADVYNTGLMTPEAIAECGKQAKAKGWKGGFMGWQFNHDLDGKWINTLAASLQ